MNSTAASMGYALHASAHPPLAAVTAANRAVSSFAAVTAANHAAARSIAAATRATRAASSIGAITAANRTASPISAITTANRTASPISTITAANRTAASALGAMVPPSAASTISKHILKTVPTPFADLSKLWPRSTPSPIAAAANASRWNADSIVGKMWNPNSAIGSTYRKLAAKLDDWSKYLDVITSARHLGEAFAAWFYRYATVRGPQTFSAAPHVLRTLEAQATVRALLLARLRLIGAQPPPGQQATSRPQLVRGPTFRGVLHTSADSPIATAAAA